jgi:hypothetical protein
MSGEAGSEAELLGPVDYLAVEFPRGRMSGRGFRLLQDAVRSGSILVLDLEFVRKEHDGSVSRVALEDVAQDDPADLSGWAGSFSGLLDDSDLAALGAAIAPGSLAGIVVYENVWAAPIMQEIIDSGSRLLGSGRVDSDDLVTALDLPVDPTDSAGRAT